MAVLRALLRERSCIDFLFQIVQVARENVAFAQFGLDLLHLLAQVKLALAFIHLILDPAVDLVFQFQHIQFLGQQFVDPLQPLARRPSSEAIAGARSG